MIIDISPKGTIVIKSESLRKLIITPENYILIKLSEGELTSFDSPIWLADGIRELVNKYLEEQNTKATDEIRDCIPEDRE